MYQTVKQIFTNHRFGYNMWILFQLVWWRKACFPFKKV